MNTHENGTRVYYLTFAVLMALLAVTVGVAFINLGPFNIIAALAIGIVKALLVILFFMHARSGDRLVWVYICAGVVWLIILIGGTVQDVLTRGKLV